MPQIKVLFLVVSLGGTTMSQIARGVAMTLSTATGVADRLIAQGFARRENDPEDRRLVRLVPTEKAVELVERVARIGQAQFSHVIRRLDREELLAVAHAQEVICKALLEVKPEDLPTGVEGESDGVCRDQAAV
jgi:DNA-binding MarR family transcriptional regulator